MCTINKLDTSHLRLQLGGRVCTIDIPKDFQESYYIENVSDEPSQSLDLEWVYGYRGKDSRNNLIFLESTNELVYPMAGIVILWSPHESKQRHYKGHTDDVMSLALHPDKQTFASGQVAGHSKSEGQAHVRIWSSETLETLCVIGLDSFAACVCCVAFSHDGNQLACVDESDNHILSIWDWKAEKQMIEARGSKEPVLDLEFDPADPNRLVSCGSGQITFWTMIDGQKLTSKRGIFEKNLQPKYIMCIAFSPKGFMVSGDSNGSIYVWNGNKVCRSLSGVHTDSVFSVTFLNDGSLISGGRGRNVVLWDPECTQHIKQIQVDEFYGPVRSVAVNADGSELYVGTTKNCILVGTLAEGLNALLEGHRDEIWGLCLVGDENENEFITAGNDGRVYFWSAIKRKPKWSVDVKMGVHCVAITPDCNLIAIGSQTGKLLILDAKDGSTLSHLKLSREQIECCSFSPDGKYLAAGSSDNTIYLLKITESGSMSKQAKCTGHSSFISHIDWSEDGTLLRSNSGDYEILYWKMPSCTREMSDDVTTVCKWKTTTCKLGFDTLGVWGSENIKDGTDVNCISVNSAKNLLASGDDMGTLKLYAYPSYHFNANKKVYTGHSSHVTNVAFLMNDQTLISVGGRDMAILQWHVNSP